jgi:hypothetical protein
MRGMFEPLAIVFSSPPAACKYLAITSAGSVTGIMFGP